MPLTWVPDQNTEVYSLDGHLLGTVAEAWPTEYASSPSLARATKQSGVGYFRLTGMKGGDLYVPLDMLADYADERLRIKLIKRLIAKQGWDKRPADLPAGA